MAYKSKKLAMTRTTKQKKGYKLKYAKAKPETKKPRLLGFPERYSTVVEYSLFNTLTTLTTGELVWGDLKINNATHPDQTFSSLGVSYNAEMAFIYQNYRVYGVGIQIKAKSIAATPFYKVAVGIVDASGNFPNSYEAAATQPKYQCGVQDSFHTYRYKNYVNLAKWFGLTKAQYEDLTFEGTTIDASANLPLDSLYLQWGFQNGDTTVAIAVQFEIKLKYYLTYYNRITL